MNIQNIDWVVFISQTGKEVMNISQHLDKNPRIIISNNVDRISKDVLSWIDIEGIILIITPRNASSVDYLILDKYIKKNSIITLHGYTRIIPTSFLNKYPKIFNGHPGLIDKYPHLKGFDPQVKAFNLKMNTIGSVIHKVTEELDSGDIICTVSSCINNKSFLEEYYSQLSQTSFASWIFFFYNKCYEK